MSVYKVAAFAAVAAVLAALLKKERADFALLVQAGAAAALTVGAVGAAGEIVQTLASYASRSNLSTEHLRLLFRVLAMSAAGEWAAAFCRDAGFSALALTTETAVKALLLCACLPLLRTALDFAAGFFL